MIVIRFKLTMKILLILIILILLAAVVSAVVCSYKIKVAHYYEVIDGLSSGFRVVLISDLHSRQYGDDNLRLKEIIAAQKADAIFMAGDMLSRSADEKDILDFAEFVSDLNELAPVYYTIGNHENEFSAEKLECVKSSVTAAGGVFLNNECADVQLGESKVRLAAILGDNEPWLDYYSDSSKLPESCEPFEFLADLRDCDLPTIWLAHKPDMMIFFEPYKEYRMDLVLGGHVHGGVWRIPGIGGVISPSEGLFPHYDKGEYSFGSTKFILSGGLTGYGWIPRIFNLPEICVITLSPKKYNIVI